MNRLQHEQDDLPLRSPVTSSRDREYTLSTGIVLSIFFGLTLVCAIFFGFGYTLGRKSLQPTTAADGTTTEGGDTAAFSKFKPAAGSSSGASSASVAPKQETVAAPTTVATTSAPVTSTPSATKAPAVEVHTAPVVHEIPAPPPAAVPAPSTAGGQAMVQIAAVSHQEDAEVLTAALKRRGYTVTARQEPGDRLIHVQVGPFATRKDAEVMRQKLLNDGYNAILK